MEQIVHDVGILDAVIYLMKKYGYTLQDFTSSKELHSVDGFGGRKHKPDLLIKSDDKTIAVEVELSLKSKTRFMSNVEDNFVTFDKQLWIVPDNEHKIKAYLDEANRQYGNIEILSYEEVTSYAKEVTAL